METQARVEREEIESTFALNATIDSSQVSRKRCCTESRNTYRRQQRPTLHRLLRRRDDYRPRAHPEYRPGEQGHNGSDRNESAALMT